MSVKTFAAIDVGSFELTMKIFDFSGKNTMREIDCIRQRIDLGSDTYANGKISNEKMDDLCHTLKEFAQIMESYKVIAYKAYGTSAIRETENTLILQDQIEQRTGIRVEILSNSEQRFLDYKSIASKGETFRRIIEEKTAILDIGGGSIQISLFDKDTLVSTQNLRLGVLRLQELLNHLNAGSTQMEQLVDELATAQLDDYKKLYLKDREIKNIIIVDDYLSPWAVRKAHERGDGNAMVDSKAFDQLMEALRARGTTELAKRMDIAEEKVPLVYISAVLTKRIAELMGAALIWAPGVTLCDGIAYEYAEQNKLLRGEHDFAEDIIACAMNISKRYNGSTRRADTLEYITTTIFDSMKKVHGMGQRERLYLRLAAILHDCGKYISMINIGEASYDIIMATEMIGLSHMEREIVANVVRFNHSNFVYYGQAQDRPQGLDKPDISTLNLEKGEVVIEEICPGTDEVTVRGKLGYAILYHTRESGSSLVLLGGALPFEERIRMEGVLPSDTVTVEGTVEDFTVNMINSRKLSLQALILLSARIEEIYDEELPVGIQGEDTEAGVEYRIAPMEVTQLAICKNDIFRKKEEIPLPSSYPNIYQILWSNISLRDVEFKPQEEKLAIQGDIQIFVLYEAEGEDRAIRSYETTLPLNGSL